MKTITEYTLLEIEGSSSFLDAVNTHIADGWQPWGNFIWKRTPHAAASYLVNIYTQAMVKYSHSDEL